MSDLFGNTKDRFSRVAAQMSVYIIDIFRIVYHYGPVGRASCQTVNRGVLGSNPTGAGLCS